MTTTLKDIAKVAGCSVNTVSLALKDSPRISKKTKEHISQVAQSLNYMSNNLARSLVLGRTGTVGLILRNISSTMLVTEARRIERYLSQLGYTLSIVASQDDEELETRAINVMLSNRVDGLLVNTAFPVNISKLEQLRESGFPIVLMSGFPQTKAKLDAVYPDLVGGSSMVVKHLIALGHKQIAFVSQLGLREEAMTKNPKFIGYKKAVCDARLPFDHESVLCLDFDYFSKVPQEAALALKSCAERHTAFFISEDEIAIPIMKSMIESGIRIPEDVAVASLDNIRYAESAVVALTSVGFDLTYITKQAVDILLGIINNKHRADGFADISVPPTLYYRKSSGVKKETL